jgi:hypothetical protein
MNFARGIIFASFAFVALFSSSHPPVNPGNFIEDIVNDLIGTLTCIDLDEKESKKNLVGTWDMSLVSVTPEIPKIPLANPIKKKSTWQIIDSKNRLLISFDKSAKWYDEPFLVDFVVSPHRDRPNSTKSACVFSGQGTTAIDSIPFVASDISVHYTDSISITMNGDDRIAATIKVTVNGKFSKGDQVNPINVVETITYTGVRISK